MFIQRRSLLATAAIPGISHAQAPWPAIPVRFITPFAPVGGVDTLLRL